MSVCVCEWKLLLQSWICSWYFACVSISVVAPSPAPPPPPVACSARCCNCEVNCWMKKHFVKLSLKMFSPLFVPFSLVYSVCLLTSLYEQRELRLAKQNKDQETKSLNKHSLHEYFTLYRYTDFLSFPTPVGGRVIKLCRLHLCVYVMFYWVHILDTRVILMLINNT